MKRVKTYAEKTLVEKDGILVVAWKKRCVCCGKEYTTFSRRQCFCSAECSKKAQKKKIKYTKAYEADKAYIRLASRAHAIGVEVMNLLEHQGQIEHKCALCGETENLEVHHISMRWLDNNPENLQWLCPVCHHKVHSDLEKTLKSQNKEVADIYSDKDFTIYSHTLK